MIMKGKKKRLSQTDERVWQKSDAVIQQQRLG